MALATGKIIGEHTNEHRLYRIVLSLSLFLEVITGASRGIGRATAIEFVKQGATCITLHFYGDEATTSEIISLGDEIRALNDSCKTISVSGDIALQETSTRIVFETVKEFGRIGDLKTQSTVGIAEAVKQMCWSAMQGSAPSLIFLQCLLKRGNELGKSILMGRFTLFKVI